MTSQAMINRIREGNKAVLRLTGTLMQADLRGKATTTRVKPREDILDCWRCWLGTNQLGFEVEVAGQDRTRVASMGQRLPDLRHTHSLTNRVRIWLDARAPQIQFDVTGVQK